MCDRDFGQASSQLRGEGIVNLPFERGHRQKGVLNVPMFPRVFSIAAASFPSTPGGLASRVAAQAPMTLVGRRAEPSWVRGEVLGCASISQHASPVSSPAPSLSVYHTPADSGCGARAKLVFSHPALQRQGLSAGVLRAPSAACS